MITTMLLRGMLKGVPVYSVFILTVVIRIVFASGSGFQPTGAERQARARLYTDLDSSPILQNRLVPLSPSCPVDVHVNLKVYKILEFVEPKQVVNMAVYFEFVWKDEAFAWNPADYANVTLAYLPYDRAWHPWLIVANSADEDFSLFPKPDYQQVTSEGEFHIQGGTILHTHCHIDLTFFPFDNQTCSLIIVVSGNDAELNATASTTEILSGVDDFLSIPGEWDVTSHRLEVVKQDVINQVVYTVQLDRAYIYYLLCVLGPMAATSQLTLLVFWIPPGSGERISYLMSIYLSATLYLGFVGDTLPRKAYSFSNSPRMVIFMIFSIIECILVLIATIISMHLHAAEEKHEGRSFESETRAERKAEHDKDKMFPRQRNVSLTDLTDDQQRQEEDTVPNCFSNSCFEQNPRHEELRQQPTAAEKERKRSRDNLVRTTSRKQRIFEKLRRFLAIRNKSKLSCSVSAQTVDRVMFLFFLTCSLLFYSNIFK